MEAALWSASCIILGYFSSFTFVTLPKSPRPSRAHLSLSLRIISGGLLFLSVASLLIYFDAHFVAQKEPTHEILSSHRIWSYTCALSFFIFAVLSPFKRHSNTLLTLRIAAPFKQGHHLLRQSTFGQPSLAWFGVALFCGLVASASIHGGPTSIGTSYDNNYGDLPFHVAVITQFARADNYPPHHPELFGRPFTYSALMDFQAALCVKLGASLYSVIWWQNFLLLFATFKTMHALYSLLSMSAAGGWVALALMIFSGGCSWLPWFADISKAYNDQSFTAAVDIVWRPLRDYTTYWNENYRFGNSLTALFIPQRTFLMAIPLAAISMYCGLLFLRGLDEQNEEIRSKEREKVKEVPASAASTSSSIGSNSNSIRSRTKSGKGSHASASVSDIQDSLKPEHNAASLSHMMFGGLCAGMLPLIHAHTFAVLAVCMPIIAVLSFFRQTSIKSIKSLFIGWVVYGLGTLLLSVPQGLYILWLQSLSGVANTVFASATTGGVLSSSGFFTYEPGWDNVSKEPFLLFWLRQTGVLPLIALCGSLLQFFSSQRSSPIKPRLAALFCVPFWSWFILCNLWRFSPWMWDNIKMLQYWYMLALCPAAASFLVYLYRSAPSSRLLKALIVCIILSATLGGFADILRGFTGRSRPTIFNTHDVEYANMVAQMTAPDAVIARAPTHAHPTLISGRLTMMGYAGHLWSHSLSYADRERALEILYKGRLEDALIALQQSIYPGTDQTRVSKPMIYASFGASEMSHYKLNAQQLPEFVRRCAIVVETHTNTHAHSALFDLSKCTSL